MKSVLCTEETVSTWIKGNGPKSLWHLSKISELRGEKTGTVYLKYRVTCCTGKQLGGAWGASSKDFDAIPDDSCRRCAEIANG